MQEELELIRQQRDEEKRVTLENATIQKDEIEKLQNELKAKGPGDERRVKELENSLRQVQDEKIKIEKITENFEVKVSTLENKIVEEENKVKEANERASEVERIMLEMEEEQKRLVNQLKEAFEDEREVLRHQVSEQSNAVIAKLKEDFDVIKGYEIEVLVLEHQKEVAEMQDKIYQAEKDLSEEREEKNLKQSEDLKLKQQISALQKELATQRTNHYARVEELTNQLKEAKGAKKYEDQKSKENQKLRSENESMTLELFQKNEVQKRHMSEIKALKEKLKMAEANKSNLTQANHKEADQEKVHLDLCRKLLETQNQLNDSVCECDFANKKLAEQENELEESNHQNHALQNKLRQTELVSAENNKSFESELQKTRMELEKRSTEIEKLLGSRQELQDQLDELQELMQSSFSGNDSFVDATEQYNKCSENEKAIIKDLPKPVTPEALSPSVKAIEAPSTKKDDQQKLVNKMYHIYLPKAIITSS